MNLSSKFIDSEIYTLCKLIVGAFLVASFILGIKFLLGTQSNGLTNQQYFVSIGVGLISIVFSSTLLICLLNINKKWSKRMLLILVVLKWSELVIEPMLGTGSNTMQIILFTIPLTVLAIFNPSMAKN